MHIYIVYYMYMYVYLYMNMYMYIYMYMYICIQRTIHLCLYDPMGQIHQQDVDHQFASGDTALP